MKPRSPEGEQRRLAALRKAMSSPEHRAKQKKAWEDPERRARMSVALQRRGEPLKPATKEKMRAAIKKAMSRPEVIEKSKKWHSDPEWLDKISKGSKEAWAKPGAREKRIKKIREAWEVPGMKEKYSGKNSRWWRGGRLPIVTARAWICLARKIRDRDDGLCQHPSCYIPQIGRLHCVHHIDYNRDNNDQTNLVTLCAPHHALTTIGDRSYWEEFYGSLQAQRGFGGSGY